MLYGTRYRTRTGIPRGSRILNPIRLPVPSSAPITKGIGSTKLVGLALLQGQFLTLKNLKGGGLFLQSNRYQTHYRKDVRVKNIIFSIHTFTLKRNIFFFLLKIPIVPTKGAT